jgi:hypothetical protein
VQGLNPAAVNSWNIFSPGGVPNYNHFLALMGMPEYEAKRYEGRIRKGGTLISRSCCK